MAQLQPPLPRRAAKGRLAGVGAAASRRAAAAAAPTPCPAALDGIAKPTRDTLPPLLGTPPAAALHSMPQQAGSTATTPTSTSAPLRLPSAEAHRQRGHHCEVKSPADPATLLPLVAGLPMVQACRGVRTACPQCGGSAALPPGRGEALSSAVARALLGAMALVDFPAGSCVAAPNQGGSALSVVVQGKAVVYPPRGSPNPPATLHRGDAVGDIELFANAPREIQAFAVTDTRILQISRGDLAQLFPPGAAARGGGGGGGDPPSFCCCASPPSQHPHQTDAPPTEAEMCAAYHTMSDFADHRLHALLQQKLRFSTALFSQLCGGGGGGSGNSLGGTAPHPHAPLAALRPLSPHASPRGGFASGDDASESEIPPLLGEACPVEDRGIPEGFTAFFRACVAAMRVISLPKGGRMSPVTSLCVVTRGRVQVGVEKGVPTSPRSPAPSAQPGFETAGEDAIPPRLGVGLVRRDIPPGSSDSPAVQKEVVMQEGGVFGEVALLTGVSVGEAVALSHCQMHVLERDGLDSALASHPAPASALQKIASDFFQRMSLPRMLRTIPFMHPLSDATICHIAETVAKREYSDGEVLQSRDIAMESLAYVVLRGSLLTEGIEWGESGRGSSAVPPASVIRAGDVLNAVCLFHPTPRSFAVRASGETTLCAIHPVAFQEALGMHETSETIARASEIAGVEYCRSVLAPILRKVPFLESLIPRGEPHGGQGSGRISRRQQQQQQHQQPGSPFSCPGAEDDPLTSSLMTSPEDSVPMSPLSRSEVTYGLAERLVGAMVLETVRFPQGAGGATRTLQKFADFPAVAGGRSAPSRNAEGAGGVAGHADTADTPTPLHIARLEKLTPSVVSGEEAWDSGKLVILLRGCADVTPVGKQQQQQHPPTPPLQEGSAYGYLSLVEATPRAFSVSVRPICGEDTAEVLILSRDAFTRAVTGGGGGGVWGRCGSAASTSDLKRSGVRAASLKQTWRGGGGGVPPASPGVALPNPSSPSTLLLRKIQDSSWNIFQREVLFGIVAGLDVLSGCSTPFLRRVVRKLSPRECPPDSYVLSEGTPGFFFIVCRGHVSLMEDGVHKPSLRDASHYGELNLFLEIPSTTSALVVEHTVCFTLGSESLKDLDKMYPADTQKAHRNALRIFQRTAVAWAIGKDRLLQRAPKEAMEQIADTLVSREPSRCDAGFEVSGFGSGGDTLYFVCQGKLDVFGEAGHLTSLNDGEIYGSVDLFHSNMRVYQITAKLPSLVYTLKAEELAAALRPTHPEAFQSLSDAALDMFRHDSLPAMVQHTPLLSGTSVQAARCIAQRLQRHVYRKGDVIAVGEGVPEAHFIFTGSLSCEREGQPREVLRDAGCANVMSLLFPPPRTVRIAVEEDTVVYTLTRTAYVEEVARYPEDRLAADNASRQALESDFFDILRNKSPLFPDCTSSDAFVRDAVQLLRRVTYPKGAVVTDYGGCGRTMIFISRGRLRKTTRLPQMIASPTSSQGREGGAAPPVPEEVSEQFFGDGEFCCADALVFDIPRLHRIEAEEETFCLELRRSDLDPVVESYGRQEGLLALRLHHGPLLSVIQRVPLFRGCRLSDTAFDIPSLVIRGMQPRCFRQGDVVVERGTPFEFLGIVSRGLIRIEHAFGEDHRGDGCCFGVAEVLHDLPRTYRITCVSEEATLLVLDRPTLLAVCRKAPFPDEVEEVRRAAGEAYRCVLCNVVRSLRWMQRLVGSAEAGGWAEFSKGDLEAFLRQAVEEFIPQSFDVSGESSARYIFLSRSERGDDMYFIVRGAVSLIEANHDIETLRDGAVVHEVALLHKTPRVFSLRVDQNTSLLALPQQAFIALLESPGQPHKAGLIRAIRSAISCENRITVMVKLLRASYLFHSCDNEAFISEICEHFEMGSCEAGATVVQPGDFGDTMIFINQGALKVVEDSASSANSGQIVKEEKVLTDGDHFGQMALLFYTTRGALVEAVSDTSYYILDRVLFREILSRYPAVDVELHHLAKIRYYHKALFHMVKMVNIFAETENLAFMRDLAFRLTMRELEEGNVVCTVNATATCSIRTDDSLASSTTNAVEFIPEIDVHTSGTEMFFVYDGAVDVARDGRVEATLTHNHFFGAVRLFYDAPRLHTLKATKKTTILVLSRDTFEEVLSNYPSLQTQLKAAGRKLLTSSIHGELYRLRKQASSVFSRCGSRHTPLLRDLAAVMNPVVGKEGDVAIEPSMDRDCMLFLARGRLKVEKAKPKEVLGGLDTGVAEAQDPESLEDISSSSNESWADWPESPSVFAFSKNLKENLPYPVTRYSVASSHRQRHSLILPTMAAPLDDGVNLIHYVPEGTFFSENSLCEFDCPRLERMVFDTDGLLLTLSREDFHTVLARYPRTLTDPLTTAIRSIYSKTVLHGIVQRVPLFERCKSDVAFIARVVGALSSRVYEVGEMIYSGKKEKSPDEDEAENDDDDDDDEDDDGENEMHLIAKGRHAAYVGSKEVGEYRDETCFGEIALIYHTPRTVNLKCLTRAQHFTLKKKDFQSILAQQSPETIADVMHIAESRFQTNVLQDLIRTVPLFVRCRNEDMIKEMTSLLVAKKFDKGSYVIRQGEGGDEMFFISRGRLSVLIGGRVVHTLTDGNFFGEIALLYDTPRIASIVALKDSYLYSLSNQGFQAVISKYPMEAAWTREIAATRLRRHVLHDIVRKVPIFLSCEEEFLTTVVNCLKPKMFYANDVIVTEGEGGNEMYFISRGALQVSVEGSVVTTMKDGDFFGEIAVVFDTPRTATIISCATTQVFILTKKDFKKVMLSEPRVAAGVAAIAEERFRKQVLDGFIKKVSFFKHSSDEFRAQVIARVKIKYYVRGSVVVQEGEGGDKMFFVSRGSLSVKVGRNVVHTMRDGDFFGEVALLYDTPRTATILTNANSNLLVLTKTDLEEVLRSYPREADDILRLARSRFQTFVLSDMLRKVPFFKTCEDDKFIHEVVDHLMPRGFTKDQTVIREGEGGDEMYFVSRGHLSVSVNGSVVCMLKDGDFFGEVALIYDTPRTATITASDATQLFVLTKADFSGVMSRYSHAAEDIRAIARERFKQFVLHDLVRKVPLFHQNTNDAFINDVVDLLRPHMYKPGEYIIEEGAGGEEMYFISRGELDVMVGGKKVHALHDGDVFGEVALIYSTPRTATITARTNCLVLDLGRKDFLHLLLSHSAVSANVHAIAKQRLYTFVLQDIVKKVPLFKNCHSDEFIVDVVRCLEPVGFNEGDYVIKEGEGGEEMYFVSRGTLLVTVNEKVVHIMNDGDFFGEIALIYDTPRTATILAKTKAQLFVLKKEVLSTIMEQYPREGYHIKAIAKRRFEDYVLNTLVRNVPIFKGCKREFVDSLVQRLLPRKAARGLALTREGEGGDAMYFISRGELSISIQGRRVKKLRDGDFFGEVALVYDTPRTATIVAQTRGNLYVLTRADFAQVCENFPQEAVVITDIAAQRFVSFIKDIVRRNPLFAKTTEEFLVAITHALTPKTYQEGERVVIEGEGGDEMYFVSRGELEVTLNSRKVHTMKDGGYFGEVALVFETPRTATITAVTETNLFMLTRDTFNDILGDFPDEAGPVMQVAKTRMRGFILNDIVRKVPLFDGGARDLFIQDVVACLEPRTFDAGQSVIREGEGGDEMYFVSRGELSVIVGEKVVHTLKDGDFFGEVALMYDTPRTASITAIVRSQLFYLKKADFTTVVVQYPTESKSIAGIARERFKQFVLHDLVRKVPLFHQNTNDAFINDVVDLLRPHMYKPGEYIIEEGAGGEEMYFISRGELDVMVGGKKVHALHDGDVFGEVALIYSTPRTASIMATTSCLVLELTRSDFSQILAAYPSLTEGVRAIAKERLRTFVLQDLVKKVPIFKKCENDEFLSKVVQLLEPMQYLEGEVIMAEGDAGDSMYFVSQGELQVSAVGRNVGTLKDGDFFGEIALIFDTPRTATITSIGKSHLFHLDKRDFTALTQDHGQEGLAFKQVAKERFKKVIRLSTVFSGLAGK